ADSGSLADQYEERCLKSVLGIGARAEKALADAPDHRPVAPEQDRKGHLVSAGQIRFQQLAIRPVRSRARRGKLAEGVPQAKGPWDRDASGEGDFSTHYIVRSRLARPFICENLPRVLPHLLPA